MEQKEIIEGNRLIAEFMGARIGVDLYSYGAGRLETLQEAHLKYHSSWGWLMPVVEKIESEEFPVSPDVTKGTCWPTVDIVNKSECEITLSDESICFIDSFQSAGSKINSVYMAVIKFIKWYNQPHP